jgi:mannose-6-phosphate isomerase-like protein (cupin superfamily)
MGGSMKKAPRMSIPDHPWIARWIFTCLAPPMEIRNREAQPPFTTKDGSTIRSLLDLSNAPVEKQSLAEATLPTGTCTERHFHRLSEEFYYVLEGKGMMEIDGEQREVGSGDAVLIPAGAWHQIRATEGLRFLCCCAPPYAHEDTFFE